MSRRDLPEVRQRRGSAAPVPGRCGGKLVLTDPPRYCTQRPRKGRKGCKFHGGNALSGIANPAYKHGLYSEVLPRHVAADYEALLQDEDLLSLRHEIAAARAYVKDRLRRLARGEALGVAALKLVGEVEVARALFVHARATGKAPALRQAAQKLDAAILALTAGASPLRQEHEMLTEFTRTALLLERLERSENLRADELYNRISAERAWALRQAETTILLEALDELVVDAAVRDAIRRRVAAKFAALIGRRDAAALGAGPGQDGPPGDPAPAD